MSDRRIEIPNYSFLDDSGFIYTELNARCIYCLERLVVATIEAFRPAMTFPQTVYCFTQDCQELDWLGEVWLTSCGYGIRPEFFSGLNNKFKKDLIVDNQWRIETREDFERLRRKI